MISTRKITLIKMYKDFFFYCVWSRWVRTLSGKTENHVTRFTEITSSLFYLLNKTQKLEILKVFT